jgi:YCII-related domain
VVRPQDGDLFMTDGPYTEGEEHVGGVCIIKAPDLDAAHEWGRKLARATTLPIEVRRFQGPARSGPLVSLVREFQQQVVLGKATPTPTLTDGEQKAATHCWCSVGETATGVTLDTELESYDANGNITDQTVARGFADNCRS